MHGKALNEGRKMFSGDLEFGQWVADQQLDGANGQISSYVDRREHRPNAQNHGGSWDPTDHTEVIPSKLVCPYGSKTKFYFGSWVCLTRQPTYWMTSLKLYC